MVQTIIPVVNGERRTTALWAHVVGSAIGGAALGGTLGVIGANISALVTSGGWKPTALLMAALLNALLALRELGLYRLSLPESHWQVPRTWRQTMPISLAAFLYGLLLGTGILTRVGSGLFYSFAVLIVLLGAPGTGMVLGVLYGLARSISVTAIVIRARSTRGDWDVKTLLGWSAPVHLCTGLALAALAGCLAWLAAT
jgi:hypothetical protein